MAPQPGPAAARELRFLHVEDNALDAELLERQLRSAGLSFAIRRVQTGEDVIAELRDFGPDLVISDYSLPGLDGLAVLGIVREHRPDLPFIFVSGTIGEERAVECLRSGATDYLIKDRLGSLGMKVRRALREVEDRRTQRLLEEQLRQSQKMEAVGRLAGGVAHDFNNVLTVIRGYADLLLALPPGQPIPREDLEEIRKAGERGAELTRQLLTFSRKRVTQPVSLDLGRVVAGLENMLARLVGSDVRIQTSVPPDLWKVTADPGQIEQVIVNLVTNARDAMPKGGRVTIEASNVTLGEEEALHLSAAKSGRYVLLAVRDTGDGIPPEVLAHLFEPFFTTKEPGRGTGLGLSTVHGIVSQMGGTIEVASDVGRGTTFRIYFPKGEGETTAGSTSPQVLPAAAGPATVLLVDDQESVRRLAEAILKSAGYTVLAAGDGAEALRLCEEYADPIHLLLTDLVMRTMTGMELAGLVRRHHPEARLLLMSGYAYRSAELSDLISAGLPFLEKPFTAGELKAKVLQVLGQPGSGPAS